LRWHGWIQDKEVSPIEGKKGGRKFTVKEGGSDLVTQT